MAKKEAKGFWKKHTGWMFIVSIILAIATYVSKGLSIMQTPFEFLGVIVGKFIGVIMITYVISTIVKFFKRRKK